MGRNKLPIITDEKDPYEIGKGVLIKGGKDVTIIACGQMVYEAMKAAQILSKRKIDARVINLHTLKPVDKKILIKAAKTGAIVTTEEHSLYGGLGSVVSEVVSQNCPVPVKMIGVSECGQSGSPQELFKCYNLTADDIAKAAKAALKMKSGVR